MGSTSFTESTIGKVLIALLIAAILSGATMLIRHEVVIGGQEKAITTIERDYARKSDVEAAMHDAVSEMKRCFNANRRGELCE